MTRPRLALIATGGTIAGSGDLASYTAAALPAQALFEAVPRLQELADWHIDQAFALDSRDLTPEHWVSLAQLVQRYADAPSIDGVVITHGTDTLEETSFALDLLVATDKPIVITAAMRPATSLSPDGPLNLVQAAQVAVDVDSRRRGVLVVASDRIIQGRRVAKTHTHAPDAIEALAGGDEGAVTGHTVSFWRAPAPRCASAFDAIPSMPLPRVDIFYASAGQAPDLIEFMVSQGAKGIVLALAGHGSVPVSLEPALALARDAGVTLVRASRVVRGGVVANHNADDDSQGWIPACSLNPLQARVLLILTLANHIPRPQIARLFRGAGQHI